MTTRRPTEARPRRNASMAGASPAAKLKVFTPASSAAQTSRNTSASPGPGMSDSPTAELDRPSLVKGR